MCVGRGSARWERGLAICDFEGIWVGRDTTGISTESAQEMQKCGGVGTTFELDLAGAISPVGSLKYGACLPAAMMAGSLNSTHGRR